MFLHCVEKHMYLVFLRTRRFFHLILKKISTYIFLPFFADKCTRKAHFYNQLRLCDGQEGGTHTYKKKLRILLARKKSFVKIQETKKNNLKKKKKSSFWNVLSPSSDRSFKKRKKRTQILLLSSENLKKKIPNTQKMEYYDEQKKT